MKAGKITLYLIIACLAQVALFNQFLFNGYLNPYVYVLFLIMLPPRLSRTTILLLGFAMGLSIDVFENSAGVHAAACVALGYFRPLIMQFLVKKNRDEKREELNLNEIGFFSLSLYSLICVILHHSFLFTIEAFSFANLSLLVKRIFYSSAFTFLFIGIYHLWSLNKRPAV
jgi:rod shape-determining protein MreD